MFRCLFGYIIWLHILSMLSAQVVQQPQDLRFIPSRFYVGDEVLLRFNLTVSVNDELTIEAYPRSEKLVIDNIILTRDDKTVLVSVKFRSFVLGSQSLDLQIGSIQVQGIPIHVSSLLDEGFTGTLAPYRPQLLENTPLLLISFVLLIFLVPPGLYFGYQYIRYLKKEAERRRYSPYRLFIKEIFKLQKTGQVLTDQMYYTQLLHLFRNYLATMTGVRAFTSTTSSELKHLVSECLNEDYTVQIIDCFLRSDSIRFGGRLAEPQERERDMAILSHIAKLLLKQGGDNAPT